MNILKDMTTKRDFTPSEQLIVDYILKHFNTVNQCSIKDIITVCHVSSATLYRFIEKMDCYGFQDFKAKILEDKEDFLKENRKLDFDFPFQKDQTEKEIIDAICLDYEQTLLSTKNLFDFRQFKQLIPKMKQSEEINIYTSAGNLSFAQNFKFQMQEIGVNVTVPVEEYEQRLCASQSDSRKFAVMITYGGRGLLASSLSKILHCNQTPVLLISSPEMKKETYYAEYQLYLSHRENHFNKISSFSTRLSLLFLLDILYGCYFTTDYDTYLNRKISYYKMIRM